MFIIWNILGLGIITFIIACNQSPYYRNQNLYGQANGFEIVNPKFVYQHTKVNWFGATFLALINTVLCPIGAMIYWFYKICTIGRKDEYDK